MQADFNHVNAKIKVWGGCNCRVKSDCPTPGACLTESTVYQCRVIEDISRKVGLYVGLTEGTFKMRYGNHKQSINHREKREETELGKYIWDLKDRGLGFKIYWRFLMQVKSYNPKNDKCNLCLAEKYVIIFSPQEATINSRSELATTCRHKAKFLLSNCK
jgi:hypothetical protein